MIDAVLGSHEECACDLHVGIGINTGSVMAGHIGSKNRKEFAVIGDTVNVGARLCSIAPPDKILISTTTYELVKDKVSATLVPNRQIKGKKESLNIYYVTKLL